MNGVKIWDPRHAAKVVSTNPVLIFADFIYRNPTIIIADVWALNRRKFWQSIARMANLMEEEIRDED